MSQVFQQQNAFQQHPRPSQPLSLGFSVQVLAGWRLRFGSVVGRLVRQLIVGWSVQVGNWPKESERANVLRMSNSGSLPAQAPCCLLGGFVIVGPLTSTEKGVL